MRPGRIAVGLAGLLACIAVAVPLAQRLSIDVMQLQLRSSYIDERQPFEAIAESFDIPPSVLADAAGLDPLRPGDGELPLARLAQARGVPLGTAKQRIAETILPRQFAGDSLLAGIGLARPNPPVRSR